jgi:hypothetical protein
VDRCFAALLRRFDRDLQLLADAILPDVVVEPPGPEALVLRVVFDTRRGQNPGIGSCA